MTTIIHAALPYVALIAYLVITFIGIELARRP